MAQSIQDLRERKRELALSLDASRRSLRESGRTLRARLNPVRAAGSYLRKYPLRVFGGTTIGIAVLTYLWRPRSREQKPRKSLTRSLLGGVISLFKPALRVWILKQAKEFMQTKHAEPKTDSLLGP